MTIEELKERVRNLSFYETDEFTENNALFISSANKALKEINTDIKSVADTFTITQDGAGGYTYYIYIDGILTEQTGAATGLIKYDLKELTKDKDGKTTFARLSKTKPDIEIDEEIYKFGDYKTILDHIVAIDSSVEGTISFYYDTRTKTITTTDTGDMQIDYNVEHLLPLLTAYYFLKEDEPDLARDYYNQYDSAKEDYLKSDMTITCSVRTDLNTEGA